MVSQVSRNPNNSPFSVPRLPPIEPTFGLQEQFFVLGGGRSLPRASLYFTLPQAEKKHETLFSRALVVWRTPDRLSKDPQGSFSGWLCKQKAMLSAQTPLLVLHAGLLLWMEVFPTSVEPLLAGSAQCSVFPLEAAPLGPSPQPHRPQGN